MLAGAPAVAAADQPTPDPSLDVRPDPAPVQSQAGSAKQRATPVQEKPAEHVSNAPTGLPVTSRGTTAQATPGQSATARSRPVPASRRRTASPARSSRPREHRGNTNHAAAITALQRLGPLLAAPRLFPPGDGSSSSGDDSGAQSLLFAALALLLLAAASASLIRMTTRLSGDLRRERGP